MSNSTLAIVAIAAMLAALPLYGGEHTGTVATQLGLAIIALGGTAGVGTVARAGSKYADAVRAPTSPGADPAAEPPTA